MKTVAVERPTLSQKSMKTGGARPDQIIPLDDDLSEF
jgi:hypothetical protein